MNQTRSILILCCALLLFAPPTISAAQAEIFYVAPNGNDANPGTLAAPWGTIQRAANTLTAGATVYVRGGIYHQRVRIKLSGNPTDGFITFAAYPGETPVLDGTDLQVKNGWDALVRIADASYVRVQGFEIRAFKTKRVNHVPIGILVRGAGEHVELLNNHIHHIQTRVQEMQGGDAHGIAVYGTRAPASYRDILIDGNELNALKLGSSEALVVNGNIERFTITRNHVHHNNNIGIDAIGFEGVAPNEAYDQARDGLIADNLVHHINSSNNPAYDGGYGADCVYVDGGTRIVVERNHAHHCNLGIELASEHQNHATSFITVRNNFVYQNTEAGISIGGYDRRRGSTQNCAIVNNSLYANDTRAQESGEMALQYGTRSNIIRNNILYAGAQNLFISNWSKANTGNVVNDNLYLASGGGGMWQWKSKTYSNFANYQNATGNDADSLYNMDPLFVNLALPDLHLQNASRAINAGANLSESGAVDIDGETRVQGGKVDLGADEVK